MMGTFELMRISSTPNDKIRTCRYHTGAYRLTLPAADCFCTNCDLEKVMRPTVYLHLSRETHRKKNRRQQQPDDEDTPSSASDWLDPTFLPAKGKVGRL